MKENLKIERSIRKNNIEAMDLFNEIGLTIQSNCFAYLYADNNGFHGDRIDYEEITLPELRELARPKEYLNDKFELVVTNQPDDGYRKIPDNANIFCLAKDGYSFFWVNGKQHYDDGRFCDSSMHNFSQWCEIHLKKILWQRENKVETSKGRFLHQWAYEAFGRGEDVQFKLTNHSDNQWKTLSTHSTFEKFNENQYEFRIKPKTIQIGSRTIVKPISVKPKIGTEYFVSSTIEEYKYVKYTWKDDEVDNRVFDRRVCHSTAKNAINHTDALLELMK